MDANSKNCIISGATDGIGKRTAEILSEKGFNLGLIGRNEKKGIQVIRDISQKSGNENIHYFNADLSLMSEVKRIASEISKQFPRIDVLINNVGAAFFNETYTQEGFESTFALNHLSYFLLTNLLLPNVNKNGARIVNVASDAHFGVDINLEDIQGIEPYSGYQNYKKSKLMNILFSNELAERLENNSITVNSLHPGFVDSMFGHNNSGLKVLALKCAQKIKAIHVDEGAETSIYLASSPDVEKITGKYFYKMIEKESSPESQNVKKRKEFWTLTEEILEEWT